MTTGVDTIKFIKDMYSKPIIWNRNCTSNKAMTEKTWIELSKKYRTTSKYSLYFWILYTEVDNKINKSHKFIKN